MRRPGTIRTATLGALGIILILLPLGCLEPTQEDVGSTASTTAALPTLEQIRAAVDMTEAQADKLGPVVERWHSAARAGGDGESFASPEMEFVAESATVLDRDQLRQLVHVLAENRTATQETRTHGGMHGGRHHGGPGGAGPFADLGLSAEQLRSVHNAMQALHAAQRTAREQFDAGTITEEAFRQAVDAAHQAFDTTLQGILTAEQYATLQQMHKDRLLEHLERRIANLRAGAAHHIELLTQILDLSPTQVQAITEIHAGIVPRLEAIVAGLEDGSLSMQAAQAALRTVHEETHAAVVAVLTPEQAALFAELRPFGHHRGPGMPPD